MNKRRKPLDLEKLNNLKSDGVIGNNISSSDLKAIREYEIGKSPVDIAEEYGYSVASFYRLLNKADRIIKESDTQVNTVQDLFKKMVNIPDCMLGHNLAGQHSVAAHKIVYITLTLYQQKEELFISRKILQVYYNSLDIRSFALMLKDPSYCYKFYWLEAIVHLISEGVTRTTFDDIIDEMICNAWYSVREFHIHLSGLGSDGSVRDGLERAILRLSELSDLPANASKVEILNEIHAYNSELFKAKEQLTHMVPYRALAGFFANAGENVDWGSVKRLTAYIEAFDREHIALPYTFGTSSRLKKEVVFHPSWIQMIQDNTATILGWIQYEKVKWLQNNNPEVPGLVYKLAPMDEKMRKLGKVRKLWNGILELTEIRDVFNDKPIVFKEYDVDHFIPWSFVMNDELWNLMPMDSSLNSVKSNRLPKWNLYFKRFAHNQFLMYELVNSKEGLHRMFEGCYRDNLHSIWAGQELYRPGNTKENFYRILQKNMQPVYDSARRQGYEIWNFEKIAILNEDEKN